MERKTSNHDRNEAVVASARRIWKQYADGLISTEELVTAFEQIATCPQSFIYAVGELNSNDLTYGTVKILTINSDPALLITSRCGDEIRVDKSALLSFRNAVVKAVGIIEKRYPTVGQL